MQPIIVTYIERKCDIENVDAIIEEANKQYGEMGIAPIFYVYSLFSFQPKYPNVFVKMQMEDSFASLLKNHPTGYIIRQFEYIMVKNNIYKWIHTEMLNGANAILFHWANPIHPSGCWHRDFLVTKDSNYYPKQDKKNLHDCMEVAWGKYLTEHNLTNFIKSHNSNQNKFYVIPPKPQIQEVIEEGVEVIENIPIIENKVGFWNTIKRWFLWQK